jgi:murein DD-endopeptidase MepM/ murein hydrolase activator NlpD
MTRLRRMLIAIVIAAVSASVPALADDLDDRLDDVEAQIDGLLDDIDAANSERTDVVTEITGVQRTIDGLRVELAAAEQALEDSTRQLNLQRVALDQTKQDLADARVRLAEAELAVTEGTAAAVDAVRRLYMGSGQEIPAVVLTADSLGAATLTLDYLERVSNQANATVVELETRKVVAAEHRDVVIGREAAVAEQIEFLEFIEQQRAAQAAEVAAQTAVVEEKLAAQRSLLAEVDQEIAFFEGELVELEKQQAELETLIASETDPGGGSVAVSAGGYVRPVPGAVTSPYGPRMHPILGYVRMHTGVDMTAPYGQAIRAMTSGRVILASTYGGYGTTVVIDHGGGMTTLYAHQSSLNVSYGASVQAGDIIGYAGATGLATGPHLHFEVRLNGRTADPAPYLAGT